MFFSDRGRSSLNSVLFISWRKPFTTWSGLLPTQEKVINFYNTLELGFVRQVPLLEWIWVIIRLQEIHSLYLSVIWSTCTSPVSGNTGFASFAIIWVDSRLITNCFGVEPMYMWVGQYLPGRGGKLVLPKAHETTNDEWWWVWQWLFSPISVKGLHCFDKWNCFATEQRLEVISAGVGVGVSPILSSVSYSRA